MTTTDDHGLDSVATDEVHVSETDAAEPVIVDGDAADRSAADASAADGEAGACDAAADASTSGVPEIRRASRWRLWTSLVAGVLLLGAAVGGYIWAWNVAAEDHARAVVELTAAEKRLASAQKGVGSSVVAASVTVKTANSVLAMDIDQYAGEERLAALQAAAESAGDEIDLGMRPRLKPAEATAPAAELFWLWSVLGSTAGLEERTALDESTTAECKDLITRLIAEDRGVATAGTGTLSAVAENAAVVIGDYASARNSARDALMRSADRLGWAEWANAETELDRYVSTIADLKTSQDAEMAEKSGSLLDTRLAAEAYARSIAGGVMLDFDWADSVIGYGWGDSMAGTAGSSWYSPQEVYATITLTNTVASLWNDGSGRSQALVAHEVGHAIHPKCFEIWPNDQANEEHWATAWSISQGHTSDANGVQAYGYPDAAMIDAARTCR